MYMLLPDNTTKEAKLIDMNFRKAFIAMSSIQKDLSGSQYVFSKIPHPIFNCVIKTNSSEENVENTIKNISDDYQKHNTPHCWWVSDHLESTSFPAYLKQMGYQLGPLYWGMHGKIKKIKLPEIENASIRIERVSCLEELDSWIQPIQASFEFSNEVATAFLDCFKDLFIKNNRMIHFIAYYDNQVAGSSTLFLDKDSAGLYNGAVLPQFRRKSVISFLGNHMVKEAKNQGLDDIVMQAADDTYNLGIKVGLEKYSHFQAFFSP